MAKQLSDYLYKFAILIIFLSSITSCSNNTDPKRELKETVAADMNTIDQLRFLIIYSNYESVDYAKHQVGRVIGCSKSTIDRVLDGTTLPTSLMQDKIYASFIKLLGGASLKSLDPTMNFFDRNIPFWYDAPTDDSYTVTLNPLYEELL